MGEPDGRSRAGPGRGNSNGRVRLRTTPSRQGWRGQPATSSASSPIFAACGPRSRRWSRWPDLLPRALRWSRSGRRCARSSRVVLQPGDGARPHALLEERLAAATADAACGGLAGDEALRLVENALVSVRLPVGRFGEPAVYVGTVREATSIPFRTVRVLGLAEGHLPSVPREDPVIPDALRAHLGVPGVDGVLIAPPTAADRTLEMLHSLDSVVRNAKEHVVLSAPRLDLERSLREPSSVMLEAAAALGRPNVSTGESVGPIPDTLALRRDAFGPARQAALEFRRATPIGERAWQVGVALGPLGLPSRWRHVEALDLDRVSALREADEGGALDGLLGATAAGTAVPGLTPERPISPSGLQTLLQCPHLFLLGTIMGLEEPASAPARREIQQPAPMAGSSIWSPRSSTGPMARPSARGRIRSRRGANLLTPPWRACSQHSSSSTRSLGAPS